MVEATVPRSSPRSPAALRFTRDAHLGLRRLFAGIDVGGARNLAGSAAISFSLSGAIRCSSDPRTLIWIGFTSPPTWSASSIEVRTARKRASACAHFGLENAVVLARLARVAGG